MKLKSDNQVQRLKKSVQELNLDLEAITREHDSYGIKGTDDEVWDWFHCLPIETLQESLDFEYNKPRMKYSLQDMKHRFVLRKLHETKKNELEQKKSELLLAKIDNLLVKIERIQNGEGTTSTGGSSPRKRASRQKMGRTKS